MGNSCSVEWDINEIESHFKGMSDELTKIEGNITKEAAEEIKSGLVDNIGKSNIGNPEYVHMAEDIKISTLKDDGMGDRIREIKGGKKTGYKWKWLEFGTVKMQGNQFMTRTMLEKSKKVTEIINNGIKKALKL